MRHLVFACKTTLKANSGIQALSLNIPIFILNPSIFPAGNSIKHIFPKPEVAPLQTFQLWFKKACLYFLVALISVGLWVT